MAPRTYDPIPPSDSSFLAFETSTTHMHLGGVAIFEAGPLLTPSGGIDIARIRAHLGSRLHLIPRYRQRLAWVPVQRRPVWVDDGHFNLHYHVRHTSLPRPGDDRQLKRLVGRIMSQRLDRGKPLWEAWIVEGLEGGRFALINKTHHCMADGVSTVGILQVLLSPSAEETHEEAPRWIPRRVPTPIELLRDEALRQVRQPLEFVRSLSTALRDDADGLRAQVEENLTGLWNLLRAGVKGAADTPLNQPVGPHRRFDYVTLDLADVKEIKNRLGGTVNDVVLATVAGAVGQFLKRHGVSVRTLDYRAVVPVSVRRPEELGEMSNKASGWLASLPIQERDAQKRLARVRSMTGLLKASKQALGPLALLKVAEWANPFFLTLGIRLTSWLQPYNLIVTNVPGPQIPLYMLGAPLLEGFPLVPLFEKQGLGVATFSYHGKLCIGVNADRELVPDLHEFTEALAASFAELCAAAGLGAAPESLPAPADADRTRASG